MCGLSTEKPAEAFRSPNGAGAVIQPEMRCWKASGEAVMLLSEVDDSRLQHQMLLVSPRQ